ncbi:hypothetical protein H6G54_16945 [Anabaena cylindrica FACHB-243]|uniref:Uncharacterized protein n=1 Tax=Anabaena cylindrica (strain ATCC 27899 / PCC 7122) TaxID=272123 RepID=K9ZEV5_ANACC|nr:MULTISPECIES: hypothetical protein [Anabaena]AFZ57733.1 hypothetical protein Anacy_2277 [Anabaena cylindrica PCC 7122]AZL96630.1 hypothetical protein [Anabaena sp. CCAP 1446/1C]MBD2419354.1 hypothetical protein [Anabaena cylindrica FACHB-243]MBY5285644.1 hypothetical protein [Anabaena sp. CCAP 1446/1C]MBY5310997.1 hypothetical protein [Anabaena sp. CCAP 1446/1C]
MRSPFIYGSIFLLSCLIIVIWWPINDSPCSLVDMLKFKKANFQVQATQVVVKPWLGKHHIYAIFKVPDKYKESKFLLTVPGNRQYCSKPFGHSQNYDDVFAEPGTHLIRHYIRTRTAVKMIFQGLYSELNNPQNWTLTFPKNKVN